MLNFGLCAWLGSSCAFYFDGGVLQSLNQREVDCISAGHKDADLWILVWSEVGDCVEEGIEHKGGLD